MRIKTSRRLFKYLFVLFIPVFYTSSSLYGQESNVNYEVEAQAIGTTNSVVPFWMRSNQFGSIPLSGVSGGFIGRAKKDYTMDSAYKTKLFDWGFGFEGRANLGEGSNLQLIEAYGKVKAGIFQLKVGRTRDVMGLNGDTALSSGNFAVSGNALGIPKIELSIPEYYSLPILKQFFAIKGTFSHGVMGDVKVHYDGYPFFIKSPVDISTFFHQKSLYVQLGKPDWKLKLYGGFNHQVFWGNEDKVYGKDFNLSPLKSFWYVVSGQVFKAERIPKSKIGNHGGSIDLGGSYQFNSIKLMLYRQSFYDVGALSKLANIADGLNGLSIENLNAQSSVFHWKKILVEFFSTKNQAGYPWSPYTKSGDENYYNNYYYQQGYSYYNQSLGNPLITKRSDARSGQAFQDVDYFINNRVSALHIGAKVSLFKWDVVSKITYSQNFGTFGTSSYGRTTGTTTIPPTPGNIFSKVTQISFYLSGERKIGNNLNLGFVAALDQGKLLNNSQGLMVKIKKTL